MADIKSYFPKAEKGDDYTANCITKLKSEHNFELNKTILATSVCSDEIIQSATNFREYVVLNTPFQLGGLAGFPFTGLTGLGAFAAHVPDDGCAIILYGPHIGISGKNQVGKVVRTGQMLETSCCGALMGTVNVFTSGSENEPDPELDYQQWKLLEQLKPLRNQITKSESPLLETTEAMFDRINDRIKMLLKKSKKLFEGNKVALIGGILINTDYGEPDYFEEREFDVQSY